MVSGTVDFSSIKKKVQLLVQKDTQRSIIVLTPGTSISGRKWFLGTEAMWNSRRS